MKSTMMKSVLATGVLAMAMAPSMSSAQLDLASLRTNFKFKRYVTIQPGQKVPANVRYFKKGGKPFLQMKKGKFIKLIPQAEMDKKLTKQELANVKLGQFFPIISNYIVNHQSKHTEVKNQGRRGTCVAHASLASLERFYSKTMNLSEQYAYKMFETRSGENCNSEGLKTTNSAKYLKNNGVPIEGLWEYSGTKWTEESHPDLNACQRNTHQDPDTTPSISSASKRYKVGSYQIIGDNNKTSSNQNRKTIDNVKYLKGIIGQGYDIVAGVYVTGPDWSNDGVNEATEIVDATPGSDGCTVGASTNGCAGGHAVVLVGYNDVSKYFIVKNSWGTGYKDDGYMKISYNYMKHYGKYGYYIKSAVKKTSKSTKTIYNKSTKLVTKAQGIKKGTRFTSGKLKVNKKGEIKLTVQRLPLPFGVMGKMTLMIFKEGTYNRVARVDSNSNTITLKYNVNSNAKLGKYYYQLVKFNNGIAEQAVGTFKVPNKNL